MSTLALVLAIAAAAAPTPVGPSAAKPAALFEAQGLGSAEIARRNSTAAAAAADCRRRFVGEQRRVRDEHDDLEELDRRAGPAATEIERERAWRQIRRERLSAKSPASLTDKEREELQAGSQDEVLETHQTLDSAHSQDPIFMRQVHSALACYHGARRDALRTDIAHEESLVKLGTGDRTRVYALRSQLRESEDVLGRSRDAARAFPDGLHRCGESQTAVLSHCLGIRFEGKDPEPACESEAIQQYIRFIK